MIKKLKLFNKLRTTKPFVHSTLDSLDKIQGPVIKRHMPCKVQIKIQVRAKPCGLTMPSGCQTYPGPSPGIKTEIRPYIRFRPLVSVNNNGHVYAGRSCLQLSYAVKRVCFDFTFAYKYCMHWNRVYK